MTPYYLKWLKEFPTVKALASSSEDKVLEIWAGLGYYSRARRLHQAARLIMEELSGLLPVTSADLKEKIPGIGRYTAGMCVWHWRTLPHEGQAMGSFNGRWHLIPSHLIDPPTLFSPLGAIASIAYGEASPIVDGNVIRVLSRVRAYGGNPKSAASVNLHW